MTKFTDSVISTIKDSLTDVEVYRKIRPIVSKIGCLHTGIGFSKKLKEELNNSNNLLPLQLYFIDHKAYVIKDFSSEKIIPAGSELVSINQHDIQDILNILLPAIPSDGYNQTMKWLALYHLFPLWYRNMVEITENFSVTFIDHGKTQTVHIKGAKFNDIAQAGFLNEYKFEKQLEFNINNEVGFLSLHSFSSSAIKKGDQKFKVFIDGVFKELKSENIKNLIVDLRYNTGGSDANAALFTSYFFNDDFHYWDRIEVTEKIAGEIKGTMKIFYRKPVQKDSIWLWQKGKTTNDFDFYESQLPAKNNFQGNVYFLINGFCMSSCADVTAILSHNKKGIFIGEETGGGYQGNNSGMMPESGITPMQLALTVPLQKYVNAVDPGVNVGRGTNPDYVIEFSVEDIISGKDKGMNFALDMISKSHTGLK